MLLVLELPGAFSHTCQVQLSLCYGVKADFSERILRASEYYSHRCDTQQLLQPYLSSKLSKVHFFFFYRKETLNSSEVTLAVCVKHKNVLSINMANHHQVKDNIPFPWTSCRGTILCVFGKHNPSTCILYLHPLVLASPNPHFFCTNCITCRQENAVLQFVSADKIAKIFINIYAE